MPAKKYYEDKICVNCGVVFNRSKRSSGRLEDASDYLTRKFCTPKCSYVYRVGINHPLYKPEGSKRKDGYVRISVNGKRKYLHRILMEQKIGRELNSNEHVHHKDLDNQNNHIDNLELIINEDHSKIHYRHRRINKKNGRFL